MSSEERSLAGGTVVWVFMGIEVLTFGLFLVGHAWGWRTEAASFAAAQARLHPDSGLRGTAMLLVGSWLAYEGVLANAAARRAGPWLYAAAAAGAAFCVNKGLEYASPSLAGISLSAGAFWFSYLFLTVLHLLHVAAGVIVLAVLAFRADRGAYGPAAALPVEAGAAYWHLVDLIWLLLFPILYRMHP
jgi:nitric oxide reductase NorE protein